MKKLRVMTILGTRPEIIRLSVLIGKMDQVFDHILIHTGQNWDYELNEIFFKELHIRKPDEYLGCPGKDIGETIGNIIKKSYEILAEREPDAILILGDTNSALCAIPAKRLKIPIFHIEAGNRCFDENVPEEINRRIVDHISDINLSYTENARRYLLAEGVRRDSVFVSGSPMGEVLHYYKEEISESNILSRLQLQEKKYIVVSAHREENIDNETTFHELMEAINAIADQYKYPVIFSTHPRTKSHIEKASFKFSSNVTNLKPLGFFDYNKLQMNAFCVLSDSGTLAEEAAIMRFPGVLLRTSTERPEAVDKGNIVIGGVKAAQIEQAVEIALLKQEEEVLPYDYQDLNVSDKIIRCIQSYTHIINERIWRKK